MLPPLRATALGLLLLLAAAPALARRPRRRRGPRRRRTRAAPRRRGDPRRTTSAHSRSRRAARRRFPSAHARSRRRVHGRLGPEGRALAAAADAASQSALHQRPALVQPAGLAGGRHDRPVCVGHRSGEARPQQARADLHSSGRPRCSKGWRPFRESTKCGCTRRGCPAARSRRSRN